MTARPESPRSPSQGIREGVFDLSSIAPADRHWWTHEFASQIVIGQVGARVEYPDSKPQVIRWEDPKLAFFLVDQRASVARHDRWATPAQAKLTPLAFCPGPFSKPTGATPVWITEAAFKAIYDTGFALRHHVSHGSGRGYAWDTVVTPFDRIAYSAWRVQELNPDAA